MIKIKDEELIHNLTKEYEDFKQYSKNNNEEELIYTKGFCRALERIAIVFGDFTEEQIAELKRPIIGNISMDMKKIEDLDIPSHIRKNIDINSKIDKK